LKVLLVSKALVVGAYQRKLEELARQPQLDLIALAPEAWRDGLLGPASGLQRAFTHGYRLLTAPLRLNGQYHLHYYPTLPRLLAQLRPDVLHMDEEPYNLATWLALRSGARLGVRSIFFTWQNLNRAYPWPFRHFERANYRRASHAIAGSPTAAKVLGAKGYSGPASVIAQFGVDPEIFSPASPAETYKRHSPVIGYAGRLVPEKGVDVLLRACARLAPLPWSLKVLGDGPVRAELERLTAALDVAAHVQFLGRVPSTESHNFYRSIDILVLPSLTRPNWVEQFGRVLIEAMACGVAVVGSESGEIPWVIGDAGLLFPEGDAAALADLLGDLIRDVERRRSLAEHGRARVLANFTQAHIAEATAQVYRSIID
jgi:glycosyltransferase involved in cell wall biosynthesis